MDEPRERLAHLRLHNGTIWRWNRPLIGFDATGQPRLRIEHRVIPSGPTVADCIANAAFYFGAVEALARQEPAPEAQLRFLDARTNFYAAAREGLEAEIRWLDGRRARVSEVIATDLLPRALAGLVSLGIDRAEADHWLAIVAARVRSGQTGAAWQRAWVARHGRDTTALTAAYLERQQGGQPVHEWTLE
jgi:gamma-glutamyl:cysteine ligase YbdK (ATP-grasp superfamily)